VENVLQVFPLVLKNPAASFKDGQGKKQISKISQLIIIPWCIWIESFSMIYSFRAPRFQICFDVVDRDFYHGLYYLAIAQKKFFLDVLVQLSFDFLNT
jgi:hypothetical protein